MRMGGLPPLLTLFFFSSSFLFSLSTLALLTSETARFLGQVADGFVCVLSLILESSHSFFSWLRPPYSLSLV
ncbi:hypothetical protein CI102_2328 [Trichoderma harzianum]|nr:hypothetical protein CI102_2328 [Trichoderma harzianum]